MAIKSFAHKTFAQCCCLCKIIALKYRKLEQKSISNIITALYPFKTEQHEASNAIQQQNIELNYLDKCSISQNIEM